MSTLDLATVRVLLVEDEEFMRDLLARLMREIPVREVATACDGKEAEEKVDLLRLKIDLIVCDIVMPNVSGLQFVKRVREGKTACDPNVPVLLLTGVGDEDVVKEAARVGINGYLKKPVAKDMLRRRMTAALTKPMVRHLSDDMDAGERN